MADMNAISSASDFTTRAVQSGKPRDPKLWKASKDFEEVLLAQFVRTMRAPSPDEDSRIENAPGSDTFNEMFSDGLAHSMAQAGGLGLHRGIYERLGGKYVPLDSGPAKSISLPNHKTE